VFELVHTIRTLSQELEHRTAHYEGELAKANEHILMLKTVISAKNSHIEELMTKKG